LAIDGVYRSIDKKYWTLCESLPRVTAYPDCNPVVRGADVIEVRVQSPA